VTGTDGKAVRAGGGTDMRRRFCCIILALIGAALLSGCCLAEDRSAVSSSDVSSVGAEQVLSSLAEQPEQTFSSLEEQTGRASSSLTEAALAAYSSLLSGDKTLLDEEQSEIWWIPDFSDESLAYEYTFLDLDGDGEAELLVQMAEDPCGYNGVFHFADGRLFCWNSDAMEMSCRDYPLTDGTMVRQYDYGGVSSYTIFCYQSGGEKRDLHFLSAREELPDENSSEPCPYYAIDGDEVDKAAFDARLDMWITDKRLERRAWTVL